MEIGWSELLVVAVVALVVIGPKDLPEMFRTLGRFTAKLRSMAREFSRAMEDAAKESGVQDVANDLRKVTSPKSMGLDAVKSAADKFEKWDPLKTARGSTAATTAAVGGAVQPAAAAAGLGSAVATGNALAAAPAGESAVPDPNAPAPSEQASPERGPHTTDLAMKRAEREAIAREAAERLRKSQPPAQSTASAFEDAPATVIVPAVTSTPLAEKPAAKRKPVAAKPAAAKPVDAPETPKRAARKPAAKTAANPDPAQQEAAKPAAKRRAPVKKAGAKTGSDEAKDQA